MSKIIEIDELLHKTIKDFNLRVTEAKNIPNEENSLSVLEDLLMTTVEVAGIRKTLKGWINEFEKNENRPKTVALLNAFDGYLAAIDKEWSDYWKSEGSLPDKVKEKNE